MLTDAPGYQTCLHFTCLGHYKRKLIAAESCSSVKVPAAHAQNIGQTAKRLAANHMSETIVDLFQAVQIKEQESEFARCSLGTLDFTVDCFHQVPVVGKPDERILGCLLSQ